ncbi:hypothetical protein HUO14_14565 [Parasphingorhabdus flavimaris]|uniref:Uncharacterized protein n=1 Tax=Parasphingorhabdus flavimaris TaxID=266812 RepID=A0ABX2N610_9SPHN|nr:hypothetical protein [Parasphingorhabdus flavimaris]NVD29119.1 hypothetical protein [Parasphingorhabdus flavimaris]
MATQPMEFEPGFPQWTEIGQDSGLDPLGMQRPIEVLFQSLLPGISTITLRLRYYSFFAWALEVYAKTKGQTDPRTFNVFHRRAEVLLALASARNGSELGVTGIEWAGRQISGVEDGGDSNQVIHFDVAADPDTPPEHRYLRNKGGAFGAIYSTQMAEMGLIELANEEIGLPFCTSAALPLAHGFEEAIGDRSTDFLQILDTGKASISQLDDLSVCLPSKVVAGSIEQSGLADALLGRLGRPSSGNAARRETIRLLLSQAGKVGKRPRTDDLKWEFFELANQPGEGLSSEICEAWALYQACDLCRLAYECLLAAALVAVRGGPAARLSMQEAVAALTQQAKISGDPSFKDFLASACTDRTIRDVSEAMLAAQRRGEIGEMVKSSVFLIAQLYRRSKEFSPKVIEWLNVDDYFQSLVSEARFYEGLLKIQTSEAVGRIISERVIKRHLWVASRKLRSKAYTFLLEPDEGVLRYRDDFRVSPSSPRLDQAIQFLEDCKLLDEAGITLLGKEELART